MTDKVEIKIAVIENEVETLKGDLNNLQESLEKYITKESVQEIVRDMREKIKDLEETVSSVKKAYVLEKDFKLIKSIVLGFVGMILVGVATALLKLISL